MPYQLQQRSSSWGWWKGAEQGRESRLEEKEIMG